MIRSLASRLGRPARGIDGAYRTAVAGAAGVTAWHCAKNALAWRHHAADAPYVDFNALFLAGRLAAEGRLADAYSWAAMASLERAESFSDDRFMPFSYPPPFAVAMSALAGLPVWAAYVTFDVLGLALFAAVLARVATTRRWALAAALCPSIYINLTVGQNGLWLGALVGSSALLSLRRHAGAGGVAGLIAATKPQVAVALPLLFALGRDWRALAAAAFGIAAALGLSVAVLGTDVAARFLAGMDETSRGLASGHYPLHRMTSVFACLRSFGVSPGTALAFHAAVAAGAIGLLMAVARRGEERAAVAGLSLMCTAFVSPYLYDYDGTVTGLGLALAIPALARSGEGWRVALPLLTLSLGTTVGMLQTGATDPLSFGAPLLLVGFCSVAATLAGRRGPAAAPGLPAAPV